MHPSLSLVGQVLAAVRWKCSPQALLWAPGNRLAIGAAARWIFLRELAEGARTTIPDIADAHPDISETSFIAARDALLEQRAIARVTGAPRPSRAHRYQLTTTGRELLARLEQSGDTHG